MMMIWKDDADGALDPWSCSNNLWVNLSDQISSLSLDPNLNPNLNPNFCMSGILKWHHGEILVSSLCNKDLGGTGIYVRSIPINWEMFKVCRWVHMLIE